MKRKFYGVLAAILALAGAGAATPALACAKIFHCYAGDQTAKIIKDVAKLADARGKKIFGDNFSAVNRIRFSKSSRTFAGDFDAVIPAKHFMWQGGVTKWRDGKTDRHDLRFGIARRKADMDSWFGGMAGYWGFWQRDMSGGSRFLVGGDYAGKYGKAAAAYYAGTGRVLSGGDMSANINFTSRVNAAGKVSYWQSKTKTGQYAANYNASLNYQPREWLKLRASWRKSYGNKSAGVFRAEINIPFNPRKIKKYRYTPDYSKKLFLPVRGFKRMYYGAGG